VWVKRVIDDQDLAPYIAQFGDQGLSSRAMALYEQQKQEWPEFRRGHDAMVRAETRRVDLESSWVICQYTPHRRASVSARVDPLSVMKRSCFLCPENLYPEERGLEYEEDYFILCNVSPIFDFHLVITHRDHVPQHLGGHFDSILRLAIELSPRFVVIYNGPRCGASAPDHLHFQALPRRNLPLATQVWGDSVCAAAGSVIKRDKILIAAPTGFSRRFLIFESKNPAVLSFWFYRTLAVLAEVENSADEPMINFVMAYRDGRWELILFPRASHRPRCYHGRGDGRLLISPGAIDMAGVFVIPRKRDYHKVDAAILHGIYQEVTLPEDRFSFVTEKLAEMKPRSSVVKEV